MSSSKHEAPPQAPKNLNELPTEMASQTPVGPKSFSQSGPALVRPLGTSDTSTARPNLAQDIQDALSQNRPIKPFLEELIGLPPIAIADPAILRSITAILAFHQADPNVSALCHSIQHRLLAVPPANLDSTGRLAQCLIQLGIADLLPELAAHGVTDADLHSPQLFNIPLMSQTRFRLHFALSQHLQLQQQRMQPSMGAGSVGMAIFNPTMAPSLHPAMAAYPSRLHPFPIAPSALPAVADEPAGGPTRRRGKTPGIRGSVPGFACAHCGLTNTPQRRHGPARKKELCNGCGLRWARSRRSSLEAADKTKKKSSKPGKKDTISLTIEPPVRQQQQQQHPDNSDQHSATTIFGEPSPKDLLLMNGKEIVARKGFSKTTAEVAAVTTGTVAPAGPASSL